MNYCCNICKKCVTGNDGTLLYSLPCHIRQEYPVEPRFATGQEFHLSTTFSDWLGMLALTDCSGEKVAKLQVEKTGHQYQRRLAASFDQCNAMGMTNAPKHPDLHEWIGQYSPSGSHLWDLIDNTAKLPLTLLGVAEYDRTKREVQSVSCESIIVHDHTHDVIKNYPRSLGAKAAWDVSTETGEIASIVLVPSTAASDYAHAAESLARWQNFNPKVVYSDIWPNGKGFWALLFGNSLVGHLGLFHFMK